MARKTKPPEIGEKFTLIQNPSNPADTRFEHHETLDYPLRRVWTVVAGDTGRNLWALTGYHVVNRLYYLVSEEEWTDEDASIDYKY